MKIQIQNHGEVQFQYTPEATIQDVRHFAAEKLERKATTLYVRIRGQSPWLANAKTFQQLGIDENTILVVCKNDKNTGIIAQNKPCTTSHINHAMKQAKNNHAENMSQHDVTHEMFDDVNEKLENVNKNMNKSMLELMSRKKGNLSEQDVKNIPKLSDQDLIAKKMSVNKISGVCSHKVITISLKNKRAKLSV